MHGAHELADHSSTRHDGCTRCCAVSCHALCLGFRSCRRIQPPGMHGVVTLVELYWLPVHCCSGAQASCVWLLDLDVIEGMYDEDVLIQVDRPAHVVCCVCFHCFVMFLRGCCGWAWRSLAHIGLHRVQVVSTNSHKGKGTEELKGVTAKVCELSCCATITSSLYLSTPLFFNCCL
jgi:hypothetical protein